MLFHPRFFCAGFYFVFSLLQFRATCFGVVGEHLLALLAHVRLTSRVPSSSAGRHRQSLELSTQRFCETVGAIYASHCFFSFASHLSLAIISYPRARWLATDDARHIFGHRPHPAPFEGARLSFALPLASSPPPILPKEHCI